jgi:hypothetical protein
MSIDNQDHVDIVSQFAPISSPDRDLTGDLSDLLLGLVAKIPVSDLDKQAFHVLKIEASVPGPTKTTINNDVSTDNNAQLLSSSEPDVAQSADNSSSLVAHSSYDVAIRRSRKIYEKTLSAKLGNSGTS